MSHGRAAAATLQWRLMPHAWKFFRAGGVDQVVVRSGADIAHLGQLDQKLWVALACPTRGLEFDTRTLDLIDTDHDGRIRAPEVVAAAEWACARLNDPELLVQGGDRLPLAALDDGQPLGAALAEEARQVLALRGRAEAEAITLGDVGDRNELLAAMRFNGDGVVTPAAAGDDAQAAEVLRRVIDTQGAVTDRNGDAGADRAHAEAFFTQAQALAAWHREATDDAAVAPWGDATIDAVAAVDAVQAPVDDYFARCRLGDYDPRAIVALNPSHETYLALASQRLSAAAPAIAALPLAAAAPGRSLPLDQGLNPHWAEAVATLRDRVLAPWLGRVPSSLAEADWHVLQARLAPARAWLARRPDNPLARLPAKDIAELAAPATRERVLGLIADDEAGRVRQGLIDDLEKLIRLQRDLLVLLHNFVSFEAFYRRRGAIFQAGTLYLDGRSCDLAVQVTDPARHALLAGMAKAYLAYCDCTRGSRKMYIVAAFTAGDVDFLFVGRNGLFYDREGQDWDATITKVIENPTSIGQAFLSPYKKFLRLVEEQVARRAAASESAAQAGLGGLAGRIANVDKPAPAPPGSAPATAAAAGARRGRFDVGTVAALGVALGSLSAVAVAVFAKFVDLGWWIPVALGGLVMAISGPSMLIAWLKLRQRSLGPILDASGWAVNGRMRVNVRLGASLSQTAHVPIDAQRALRDPFAERHGTAWAVGVLVLVFAVALTAWRQGWLNPVLPEAMQVRELAPAVVAPAAGGVPGAGSPPLTVLPAGTALPAGTVLVPAPGASAPALR